MLFLVGTMSSEPESCSEQLLMITKKINKFSFIARESVLDTMGTVSLLMSLGCSQGGHFTSNIYLKPSLLG